MGIVNLIAWVHYPSTPLQLFSILEKVSEVELITAATALRGNVGRIAWCELAKRWGYFAFDIAVSRGAAGAVDLAFSAQAQPIHELPQYS